MAVAFGTCSAPSPPVKTKAPPRTPVPQSDVTVTSKVSEVSDGFTGDSTMMVESLTTSRMSAERTRPGVCVPEKATLVQEGTVQLDG